MFQARLFKNVVADFVLPADCAEPNSLCKLAR